MKEANMYLSVTRGRGSWQRGLGLAAITGLRTALGPALVTRISGRVGPKRIAYVFAACELLFDKLPRVPNRTEPGGLAARALSGALVAVASRRRGGPASAVGAALLGSAAAVVGAIVGLRLRRGLTRFLGGGPMANAVSGALEDAGAVAAGLALARRR
jgi:uncharacterized membrane protein